jgi:hypothetical protein
MDMKISQNRESAQMITSILEYNPPHCLKSLETDQPICTHHRKTPLVSPKPNPFFLSTTRLAFEQGNNILINFWRFNCALGVDLFWIRNSMRGGASEDETNRAQPPKTNTVSCAEPIHEKHIYMYSKRPENLLYFYLFKKTSFFDDYKIGNQSISI